MREAKDILRLEAFGGLYYLREAQEHFVLRPEVTAALVAAERESLLTAWARAPACVPLEREAFATLAARLQADGLLDGAFRTRARVVRPAPLGGSPSAPLMTHLQLTRECNLRCHHCFVDIAGTPAPNELSTAQLRALFAELSGLGSPNVIVSGGEPLLRRDFFELAEAMAEHELDVSLCTNATVMSAALAERLASTGIRRYSVSFDGPDAASHDAIRGPGRFALACRGVEHMVAAGLPNLQLRVTVTARLLDRLLEFAALAQRLGVGHVAIKPFRMTETGAAAHGRPLAVERRAYERALAAVAESWPTDVSVELDDGVPVNDTGGARLIPDYGCVGGNTQASVTYDGRVVACGFVQEDGDWTLHDHGFEDCWRNAPTLTAWRRLEPGAECRACSNLSSCAGGCRARARGAGATVREPDPWAVCGVHAEAHGAQAHTATSDGPATTHPGG